MIHRISKLGLVLAGVYVALSAYLIAIQGLFGESFVAIVLSLPWSLAFSFFEYFSAEGALLYVLLLAPMALNAYILYCIGSFISRPA